jgi:translation initiation factor IF-2
MALSKRPPVITIMVMSTMAKTSLLDYIRSSRVAVEAGGITHIGAYQVEFKEKLTLLIPGHAAFNK